MGQSDPPFRKTSGSGLFTSLTDNSASICPDTGSYRPSFPCFRNNR